MSNKLGKVKTNCAWCGKEMFLVPSALMKNNYCSAQHLGYGNAKRLGADITQLYEEMKYITWSNDIAYLIGLIATDGTLRKNRKQIKVSNKDIQIMNDLKEIIQSITGREQSITDYVAKFNEKEYMHYQIQFTSYPLYEFLLSIGVEPNNTSSIGKVEIADEFYAHVLRRVIDGEGNYNYQNKKHLYIRIYSGSEDFLNWLNRTAIRIFGLAGGHIRYEGREIGSRYILYFQSNYDVLKIIDNIYEESTYACKRKKDMADYMLENMAELKSKFKKNQLGTVIECAYTECENEFTATTHNRKYCDEHKY